MTDKLTMPMGEYGEEQLSFNIEAEPAGNGLVLSVTAGGEEYYLYERDWLRLRDLLDAMRTTAPDDTPTGGDAEPTAPWTPTDAEIREFFIEGVDALYSLTAHPRFGNPGQAFDRWLARRGEEATTCDGGNERKHDRIRAVPFGGRGAGHWALTEPGKASDAMREHTDHLQASKEETE